jgi:molecular chaperone DnaK (HSP70)
MSSTHIIGIDLGTTNCAMAYARLDAGATVVDFPIPQLQRAGTVAALPLLPSCLYVPGEHELPPGATTLPWGETPGLIAGEFARWQGARVPGRLVASAKSWLCHAGVDRAAPILPWGAPAEVTKISPVEATARLLAHMAAAWNHAQPGAPLADQEVVITVPASFDEVARALTVTAAQQAGYGTLTLVEEPQAAFYDFTSRHQDHLAKALKKARLVLVVDVGGGTSDFTLIEVGVGEDGPALRRIAVGDHLMLGGDNMDAALARLAEERLLAAGRKLGATQWTQLVQATRDAKEKLLGADAPDRYGITLVAAGSRLLSGMLSCELHREETQRLILDGFFPACAPDATPLARPAGRVALQELGLPYAQDPAVTHHLAAFLRQHAAAGRAALGAAHEPSTLNHVSSVLPRPDAILLNGGVFNSPQIAQRLVEVVTAWWPEAPPVRLLPHDSLERAVARGAAWYGLVRRGQGRRIRGGAARAFYIGLAAETEDAPPRAVCLLPRGHEEGQPVDLDSRPFTLALGRPVQFPLFATTADRTERPGDVVAIDDDFRALPPIHTLLQSAGAGTASVPVHLRATLTEVGTLELWCVSNAAAERWRLEFELRGVTARPAATVTEALPARYAQARDFVKSVFGNAPAAEGPKNTRQLFDTLERALGPRESWRLPLLRELWSTLDAVAKRRRGSALREQAFFQLTGYCLRPGFGYPLDEWRCSQTFAFFAEGIVAHGVHAVWNDYWVMWRRIAGGLTEAQQQAVWGFLKPHLAQRIPPPSKQTPPRPKGVRPQGLDEMVRAAASLEHLDAAEKVVLGNWIAERLQNPQTAPGPWAWALGRLGTRAPIYGSGHKTVAAEQAAAWQALLLGLDWAAVSGAAFAAAQLARLTGDRTRDLDEALRTQTVDALRAAGVPAHWLRLVTEVAALDDAEEARALGDTLPLGLKLR